MQVLMGIKAPFILGHFDYIIPYASINGAQGPIYFKINLVEQFTSFFTSFEV